MSPRSHRLITEVCDKLKTKQYNDERRVKSSGLSGFPGRIPTLPNPSARICYETSYLHVQGHVRGNP